ncbi:hypothetical protein MSSIT_2157 [Methanosarcina siciliae T4/M]|uniref:Uncharacterized protein n=3 Tax=Methanosarcina siciliae TaxID=38027 RepID=A0A0E3PDZ3_9EURY|nr:hypothetical protein [Methanosarcina siciliae]AKB28876.1 hypothetical protein MSSIT_2157 [Methanosarcina siciliae T4/M]AKB32805.1 hypothetical protein MSSIH_2115 [Methanosarcina siciliae HI350]
MGVTRSSRRHSFPEMSPKRPSFERKKATFTENNTSETKTCKNKNYDYVMHQTVNFYLPILIRIKATDREGNSIEVTY